MDIDNNIIVNRCKRNERYKLLINSLIFFIFSLLFKPPIIIKDKEVFTFVRLFLIDFTLFNLSFSLVR